MKTSGKMMFTPRRYASRLHQEHKHVVYQPTWQTTCISLFVKLCLHYTQWCNTASIQSIILLKTGNTIDQFGYDSFVRQYPQ